MNKHFEHLTKKKLITGIISVIIYILWVIWLGNYWFLLGLPIVFDMYLTKKVNWSPWKKREGKNHILIEWFDAIIFAVIAVTIINIFLFQNYKIPTGSMEKSLLINDHLYVSKMAYGPRIPNTPLALPFMQHTLPGSNKRSFVEWVKWDYKRLKGFTKVKRYDPVVFNFPEGDTVAFERSTESYYEIVMGEARDLMAYDQSSGKELKPYSYYENAARKKVWNMYTIVIRPVDKTDNYIKRCVGIPGDSLEIRNSKLYVNNQPEPEREGIQHQHWIYFNTNVNKERFNKKYKIYRSDMRDAEGNLKLFNMPDVMADEFRKFTSVDKVEKLTTPKNIYDWRIWPHTPTYPWNVDNFGPIYIPKKGVTVEITLKNLPLYKRIIDHYEKNDLEIKDSVIYINGEPSSTYTFKMDYYWMMGDNRHASLDARYWGFVPEDHIIGRPRFVWLSLDPEKSFPANLRLHRTFTWIK